MATWKELSERHLAWNDLSSSTWKEAKDLPIDKLISLVEDAISAIPDSHSELKISFLYLLKTIAISVVANKVSDHISLSNIESSLVALLNVIEKLSEALNLNLK